MKKQKVYELTTNGKDGYAKWMVRGIKNDAEARQVALKGFGKEYYSKELISYYDDYPSEYGTDWSAGVKIYNEYKKRKESPI